MRYFLFDWDGCLADTLGLWMRTYMYIYRKHGLKPDDSEILEKSWGNNELGPKNMGLKNHMRVFDEIVKEVRKNVAQVPLHHHTKETLVYLKKQGAKIAIVTSSPRSVIGTTLAYYQFNGLYDALCTEEDVSHVKPDPEIVLLAMRTLNAEPESSIIIGDTVKDILAGKNAGIATALILHESNRRFYDFDALRKTGADYVFPTLDPLITLI